VFPSRFRAFSHWEHSTRQIRSTIGWISCMIPRPPFRFLTVSTGRVTPPDFRANGIVGWMGKGPAFSGTFLAGEKSISKLLLPLETPPRPLYAYPRSIWKISLNPGWNAQSLRGFSQLWHRMVGFFLRTRCFDTRPLRTVRILFPPPIFVVVPMKNLAMTKIIAATLAIGKTPYAHSAAFPPSAP